MCNRRSCGRRRRIVQARESSEAPEQLLGGLGRASKEVRYVIFLDDVIVLRLLVLHCVDYSLIVKDSRASVDYGLWIDLVCDCEPGTEIRMLRLEISPSVVGFSTERITD